SLYSSDQRYLLRLRPRRRCTLFPYTTLFRSGGEIELDGKITVGDSGEIDMGTGVVVGIETQSAIADLDAEDELEDVITKVNEILAALRGAKIIEESGNGNGGG